MPFGTIHNVSLRGITCALPDNRVFTRERTDLFDAEELKRFEEGTGVTSTCRTLEKQLASDLCYEAAEALLNKLGWERESIGALIYISSSFDYLAPATACVLQHRLGLSVECIAEDINMGCSAYVYGLATIGSLMQTSDVKRALLLCGENSSKAVDPQSTSGLLYGDAGTATALEKDEGAAYPIHYLLRTDGNKFKSIFARDGGERHPHGENNHVKTSSVDVFAFSIREVPKSIIEFMERFDIQRDDIDLYAFYQANEKVIGRIIKWCKLPPEKVPLTLTKFGNTSAASIPIVIATDILNREHGSDVHVLASGLGVGLSWGVADIFLAKDMLADMFFTRNYYDDDNDCTVTAP